MFTPSYLPRYAPFSTPVVLGVLASWIPVSLPVMAGLACGAATYAGLRILTAKNVTNHTE